MVTSPLRQEEDTGKVIFMISVLPDAFTPDTGHEGGHVDTEHKRGVRCHRGGGQTYGVLSAISGS